MKRGRKEKTCEEKEREQGVVEIGKGKEMGAERNERQEREKGKEQVDKESNAPR